MFDKIFPWTLLLVAYATERGYDNASPKEQEEIIDDFVTFMESKIK